MNVILMISAGAALLLVIIFCGICASGSMDQSAVRLDDESTPRDVYIAAKKLILESGKRELPNGCTLYWTWDGPTSTRKYYSDEVGGGVDVWLPAIVDDSTLIAAIAVERELQTAERVIRENKRHD